MSKHLFFTAFLFSLLTINAQTILFEDDFESYSPPINTGEGTYIPTGYTSYDVNGNGYNWGMSHPDFWSQPVGNIYSGNFMISATYLQSGQSVHAENILVLPAIQIPTEAVDVKLSYLVGSGTDTGYFAEKYKVIVTTENAQAAILAATPIHTETLSSQGGFVRTLPIDGFAGQTIYISFFHTESYDKWILGLDDIVVSANIDGGGGEDPVYCTPAALICDDGDLIYNITFAGINNDTDCSSNGYGDYTQTADPAQVIAGETYEISMTIGDGWYEKVSMWIDFNNNGLFEESERYDVVEGSEGGTFYNNITIPTDAAQGLYRMRFYLSAAGSSGPYPTNPCVNTTNEIYGEIEDYMVEVGTLAVQDLAKATIALYPNPVNNSFKLDMPQSFDLPNVVIIITEMTGKVAKTFKASNNYDISDLSPGIYVLTVSDGKNALHKKLIKK